MRNILPILFFIGFVLSGTNVIHAQIPDSIAQRLSRLPDDTTKVNTYNSLLREYINQDPNIAYSFGEKALEISQKIDHKKGIALSTMYLGIVNKSRSDYTGALKQFRIALSIYEELGDEEGIAKCSNNIGNVYREQGQQEDALNYYLSALKIFEELKNKQQISILYNNIALVHYELGNNQQSLEYHKKSMAIKKELGDAAGISASYNNMGTVFRNQNELDKALEMFTNSLALDEQLNDRNGITVSLNNIGLVHYSKRNFEEALSYYFKALEVSRSIDFKDGEALAMIGIGDVYNDQGKHQQAISYFEKSLKISRESNIRSRIKDCYGGLSKAHYGLRNYQEAHDYLSKFSALKDSMLNEEATSIIARIQESYNTERKDRQIEVLEKNKQIQEVDLKRKNTTIYSLYAGIVLVLTMGFFIYQGSRAKQKANIALSSAYKQIEEKNKDITDSINYAQKIQTAILPDINLFRRAFPDSFILYRPKDIVSGDFYYFSEVEDGYIIAAGDCTGHGVPGAFMSMIGNDLLNHIILQQKIYDPARILAALNDGVVNALKQGQEEDSDMYLRDGMDIAICYINKSKDKLVFAGAHRPLFIVSSDNSYEIKADKTSIGGRKQDRISFTENVVKLNKGDVIYMYSDGFVDQFGGNEGKKFMSRRFKEVVTTLNMNGGRGESLVLQEQRLSNIFNEWMGDDHKQIDDVLVMGIRV